MAHGEKHGISQEYIMDLADVLIRAKNKGTSIGVVCGGGNFFRGREDNLLSRQTSDYIGMLGTVMNGLALRDALKSKGAEVFPVSALNIPKLCPISEPFEINDRLNRGEIAIFSGGTGNPYFSTDTTAAFRALEIGADMVLFAKNGTDGVYNKDPNVYSDAVKYGSLSMTEIIEKNLQVIDLSAASLFRDNKLNVRIFGMDNLENLLKVLENENLGTHVRGE